jgi:hypothetical protein
MKMLISGDDAPKTLRPAVIEKCDLKSHYYSLRRYYQFARAAKQGETILPQPVEENVLCTLAQREAQGQVKK